MTTFECWKCSNFGRRYLNVGSAIVTFVGLFHDSAAPSCAYNSMLLEIYFTFCALNFAKGHGTENVPINSTKKKNWFVRVKKMTREMYEMCVCVCSYGLVLNYT